MKTAVIFTGGTIGSASKDGYIRTDKNTENILLNLTDGGVELFEPYFIHSEQLNGEYLTKLISCVGDRLGEDYDGIIVTHGTDTLQYSAAALALAYGNCDIPVVLVSANYVLTDPRSNGKDNFKYAVEFLKQKVGGVFVSYRNTGELPRIFPADSLLKHPCYSDSVSSVCGEFGYFKDGKFIRTIGDYGSEGVGRFALGKKSPVLWLSVHPGMKFPSTDGYRYVLIEGYHSGTLPTEDEDFIEFCEKSDAKIFLVGMPEGERYESAEKYKKLNIVVCPQKSPIYMYMKLWYMAENEQ